MKTTIQILLIATISIVFMSCKKKEVPILEIYVSAKKSELYQHIDLEHSIVLIEFSDYVGVQINNSNESVRIDLSKEDSPKQIRNNVQVANIFAGMKVFLHKVQVQTLEEETLFVNSASKITSFEYIGPEFEMSYDQRYRIDIVYDIDKSVVPSSNNRISFDANYEFFIEQI